MEGTKMSDTQYTRLGGYDAVAAVADDLLARLTADDQLGRFWQNRGEDGVRREKQLLIDFLCASAGGPLVYVGRDMETSHRGMGIDKSDWNTFRTHLEATLDHFDVPTAERADVLAFIDSTKNDIVDSIAPPSSWRSGSRGRVNRPHARARSDRTRRASSPPDRPGLRNHR
jgi:hemoglobin